MSDEDKTALAPPPPAGGGSITVVFSAAGGLGSYGWALQPVGSGSGYTGYLSPSGQAATGTLSPGVYTGVLEASGDPSGSVLYGSTTFTGDVTLVYGPMVTVLEDG